MSGTSILPHPMRVSNAHKWIAWVTAILTLLLALFAFILSFNALTDLAASHGVSIPPLFPLVVEFAVVIFSLNALYRSLGGEKTAVQWILIIGASLLASTFNVVHANTDFISRAMAAMPSLFLLLSFETLMGQVRHVVSRSNLVRSLAQLNTELSARQTELNLKHQEFEQLIGQKQVELDTLVNTKRLEVDQLNSEAEQLKAYIEQSQVMLTHLQQEIEQAQAVLSNHIDFNSQNVLTVEQRRNRLVNILNTEGNIGVSALASKLNIARGTVYNDLNVLAEAGVIHKNSQGWEVVQ